MLTHVGTRRKLWRGVAVGPTQGVQGCSEDGTPSCTSQGQEAERQAQAPVGGKQGPPASRAPGPPAVPERPRVPSLFRMHRQSPDLALLERLLLRGEV